MHQGPTKRTSSITSTSLSFRDARSGITIPQVLLLSVCSGLAPLLPEEKTRDDALQFFCALLARLDSLLRAGGSAFCGFCYLLALSELALRMGDFRPQSPILASTQRLLALIRRGSSSAVALSVVAL